MSVQNNIAGGESMVLERPAAGGVYASLFEKINLSPVSELSALDIWQDAQAMSDATADERLTAGMQVFLECLTKAGAKVEKLDKSLIDQHIAELDYQISRQLDAVMHHEEFQAVEGLWRGVKSLIDKTDFRQNVKIELLSMSKEDLRQDFEDSPEIIQSGLYKHTYIDEYDTPGGEPIAALISAYEFDASAQDVALLRTCRLSALQVQNSSLKSPWKRSLQLNISVTILTAQSTSSGNRSAIPTTLAISAWSCRAYWDVYRTGRIGDEAMDAGSQLLVALKTDNEQEAQGWKPDGLLYQDFLVMLRVYLGWRFKARITLTTPVRLLAAPPLGENPFWLGMNGVLGAEADSLPDDIPETFTTELGYYRGLEPAKPQQGNRRVTYKFN